jgi:hypothetical protein
MKKDCDPALRNRILERLLLVAWLPRKVRYAIMRELPDRSAPERVRSPIKEIHTEAQWREMQLRVRLEQYKRQRVNAPLAKLAREVCMKTTALGRMLSRSKLTDAQRRRAKELAHSELADRVIT